MGIFRLVIIAALIWLVWRILRRTLLAPPQQGNPPPSGNQKMVRCAECGVHTPESLAVRQNEQRFCCEDHRQQWLEKNHD